MTSKQEGLHARTDIAARSRQTTTTSQLSSPHPLRPSFKQILIKLPSLSSGSHNKTPQMGWLKQRKLITYSSGGLAAGPRRRTVLAWPGSGEESSLFPASAPCLCGGRAAGSQVFLLMRMLIPWQEPRPPDLT